MRAALEMHRTLEYFEEREPKVLENSARISVKWSPLLVFLVKEGVSEGPPCATLSAESVAQGGPSVKYRTSEPVCGHLWKYARATPGTLYGVKRARCRARCQPPRLPGNDVADFLRHCGWSLDGARLRRERCSPGLDGSRTAPDAWAAEEAHKPGGGDGRVAIPKRHPEGQTGSGPASRHRCASPSRWRKASSQAVAPARQQTRVRPVQAAVSAGGRLACGRGQPLPRRAGPQTQTSDPCQAHRRRGPWRTSPMRPCGDRTTSRPRKRREAGRAPAIGIEARKGRDPAPPGLGAKHESPGPQGHRPPKGNRRSRHRSLPEVRLGTDADSSAQDHGHATGGERRHRPDKTCTMQADTWPAGGTTVLAKGRTCGLRSRREAVTDSK